MLEQLKTLWRIMRGERGRYLAAIGALVVASCLMYLVPLVPQLALDGVIDAPGQASPFVQKAIEFAGGRAFLEERLWLFAAAVTVLTAMAGLFTYLRGRWGAQACESIVRRLRDQLYDHLQRLPCSYHDRAETGDVVQRCTSDVETVRLFLSTQVVEIGRALIMFAAPMPLMLALDGRMTLVAVALVPPIVVFAIVFFFRVKSAFKQADEAEGRMTSTLQENLTGIRVVRAFARQEFECAKFDARTSEYRRLDFRMYRLLAWYFAVSDFLCFLQRGLVVGAGAWWLSRGEMQAGTFYFFLAAVSLFIWPVRHMGRILADLGKAVIALGRIHEVLQRDPEDHAEAPEQQELASLQGAIEFDHVDFSHAGDAKVLRGVSFRVQPGQTLAILGPSGAGKSTIIHLLLRFYELDGGSIRLDGRELGALPRAFVRGQIGAVLQEPFLYSKTVRENLALGRAAAPSGSDEEHLVEAASIACVHDTIASFERGYDTLVGERGVTLSGGQRQRVAIARALLRQPRILVLDDALSAVDTQTETMILDALRRRRGRHTTIVIAHRLSTLMHADRIIVLDRGRIIQQGTHPILVREAGLYQRLWGIQTSLEDDLSRELELAR